MTDDDGQQAPASRSSVVGRPLKLAIVIPGFQADDRDWCIPAFTNLAQELSKSTELHVFALLYPHRRDTYRIGDVTVHALGGGALRGRRVKGASLLKLWRDTLKEIETEHRRTPFGVIIGVWATESGWLAARAASRLGLPSIIHLAGGELTWIPAIRYGDRPRNPDRLLVPSTLRQASILTVPSSPMKRTVLRRSYVDSQKIREWPLGVDTETFAPYVAGQEATKRPFTFVCVGSLVPVKGHEWLLIGFAILKRTRPNLDVHLRIVGSGPLLPHLQGLARALGLQGYVDFVGEVAHDSLPGIYRQADCFVIGSWHEAQCMAALEALSCGLPWIGPPVGALADLAARNPPTGIAVHHRSTERLADAINDMVAMPPHLREALGKAGRECMLTDYNLKTQARRLLELVHNLES